MDTHDITYFGRVRYRNDNRIFGIKDRDRLNHLYCLGKSGTGKSTLLLNMAISDIERGNGLAVIDPHGDLAEELLSHIPNERLDDVIYFSPSEFPIPFNPLRNIHPEFQDIVASGILSTFQKLYGDSWGPRLAYILRNALLTLLEYRHATLLDIGPILTDVGFREHVLGTISNPDILKFWRNEFDKYSKSFQAEVIAPILNKVGIFTTSKPLKAIFGQQTRGLDIEKIMNEGKILICNISKGTLGEGASTILGSMLLSGIQLAALSRARQPEHARRSFYTYIDEMHNYMTLSIADMLSECRKYGLSLFLAHQFIDQLSDEIRTALFGNVGTLIAFRVGATDAEYLAKEFYPHFTDIDFINLPRYCMYLKLQIDGASSQPFSASSLPVSKSHQSTKEIVLENVKHRYRTHVQSRTQSASPRTNSQTSLF